MNKHNAATYLSNQRVQPNAALRLLQRELAGHPGGAGVHTVRSFSECILPSHKVLQSEAPNLHIWKFVADGSCLVCFSLQLESVVLLDYLGPTPQQTAAAAATQLGQQQSVGFNSFFKERWRLPLCSGSEQLCRDFGITLHNGRFLLLASSTPQQQQARPGTAAAAAAPPPAAAARAAAGERAPQQQQQQQPAQQQQTRQQQLAPDTGPVDDGGDAAALGAQRMPSRDCCDVTTFHVVDVRRCIKVDQRQYMDDHFDLSGSACASLHDNTLALTSIRQQTIHLLQVNPDGTLTDVQAIGRQCQPDDNEPIELAAVAEQQWQLQKQHERQQQQYWQRHQALALLPPQHCPAAGVPACHCAPVQQQQQQQPRRQPPQPQPPAEGGGLQARAEPAAAPAAAAAGRGRVRRRTGHDGRAAGGGGGGGSSGSSGEGAGAAGEDEEDSDSDSMDADRRRRVRPRLATQLEVPAAAAAAAGPAAAAAAAGGGQVLPVQQQQSSPQLLQQQQQVWPTGSAAAAAAATSAALLDPGGQLITGLPQRLLAFLYNSISTQRPCDVAPSQRDFQHNFGVLSSLVHWRARLLGSRHLLLLKFGAPTSGPAAAADANPNRAHFYGVYDLRRTQFTGFWKSSNPLLLSTVLEQPSRLLAGSGDLSPVERCCAAALYPAGYPVGLEHSQQNPAPQQQQQGQVHSSTTEVPGQQQGAATATTAAAAGSARQQAVGLAVPGAALAALPSSRSSSSSIALRGLGLSTGAHVTALGAAAVHAGRPGGGAPAAAAAATATGSGLANRAGVDNGSSGRQHIGGASGARESSDSSSSRKAARERLRFLRQVVLMVLPGLQSLSPSPYLDPHLFRYSKHLSPIIGLRNSPAHPVRFELARTYPGFRPAVRQQQLPDAAAVDATSVLRHTAAAAAGGAAAGTADGSAGAAAAGIGVSAQQQQPQQLQVQGHEDDVLQLDVVLPPTVTHAGEEVARRQLHLFHPSDPFVLVVIQTPGQPALLNIYCRM